MEDVYPLTIIADRYYGTYSKAKFLAFNLDYNDIPESVDDSDIECNNFWFYESKNYNIGKGSTPNKAYKNLLKILNT